MYVALLTPFLLSKHCYVNNCNTCGSTHHKLDLFVTGFRETKHI